jgi:conjugal transfer pilus assembly protein TraB
MENQVTKIAREVSKKQKMVLSITIAAFLLVVILFATSGNKKKGQDLSKIITNSKNKIVLQDPSKGIKAEDRWLYEAQNKLDDVDEFMKESEQSKGNLESRIAEMEKKYEEDLVNKSQLIETQSSEIQTIKSQLKDLQANKNLAFNQANEQGVNQGATSIQELPKAINSVDFNLENLSRINKKGIFSIDDYVPAGAYAKATIISGVDAAVGISSQSDPRPILIRVQGPAMSSIYDGNIQKNNLTGCLITGAASGDLSSEKVYVKLINMTCGKSEDSLTEIAVKGYVAGQGKSGIRGEVVSREGDLVAKTFLAGLVSGFGQGLAEKVAPPLNFSNGLTTQASLSTEDVAKKGLGKGIATSSDRLSDIFVNKIEQYQPVVSIPSGIDVEVVFV